MSIAYAQKQLGRERDPKQGSANYSNAANRTRGNRGSVGIRHHASTILLNLTLVVGFVVIWSSDSSALLIERLNA
jgi:hypothetical protein